MLPTPPVAPVTTISPPVGLLTVLFHAMNGKRGGIACGADRHRLKFIETGWNRHHRIARQARIFSVTTIARFGEARCP